MRRLGIICSAVLALGGCGTTSTTTTVERTVVAQAPASTTTTTEPTPRKAAPAALRRSEKTVPNELGKRLDVAENNLNEAGLSFRVLGGGLFGVMVRSDWTVCETEPTPESAIKAGGRVKLIIKRSCE